MEQWILNELSIAMRHALSLNGIREGKVGLLSEKENLYFVDESCSGCSFCLQLIQDKRNRSFQNRGCFNNEVESCFSMPIIARNTVIGILVTEKSGSPSKARENFRDVIRLVTCYAQCQGIKKLSVKQWGEENAISLVGLSSMFVESLRKLEMFAQSDNPVLITGESGVGKELLAKTLYLKSNRRGKPFICINCGQFHDEHLMVSELFGHKKGSFTGAIERHRGLFEAANGGVIFLDEVGELSPTAQTMLLRALSEGEIKPLGENSKKIDVRVVAATNRDLKEHVQSGKFRRDLYYRLKHFPLWLPPLRKRSEDVRLLVDYYLERLNRKHGAQKRFSQQAVKILRSYWWPGNVRELKSVVELGFSLSDSNIIEPAHFCDELQQVVDSDGGRVRSPLCDQYLRMKEGKESFWNVVQRPFLDRELNRSQVRSIIRMGLKETNGSYKALVANFNIPEAEYMKFMDFLRHHCLKPPKMEL